MSKYCFHYIGLDLHLAEVRNALDRAHDDGKFGASSASAASFGGVFRAMALDCKQFKVTEPERQTRVRVRGKKPMTKKCMKEQAGLQANDDYWRTQRC